VIVSSSPTKHPKILARSPIKAVRRPIIAREDPKQSQPPKRLAGGIMEKMTFQVKVKKCIK
jgi:hypothetical protein